MRMSFAALIALLALSGQAFAREGDSKSETKMKLESAKQNKVEGDLDEEITNARMRADSGSKSKWSVSTTMTYQGGTIEEPFSKDRANPNDAPVPARVRLSGDVGARYRLSKNNSLKFGTGVSVVRPFHGIERTDVSTPFVSFNSSFAAAGLQQSVAASISAATDKDDRDLGIVASPSVTYSLASTLGKTAWTTGLAFAAAYTFHDKVAPRQQDYSLAAYPFAEYAFSDRYQFRTVFRPWIYNHIRSAEGFTFRKDPWTQSAGLGIVVTRDIYLYPNFQWRWEDWREANYNFGRGSVVKTTTVGLSATINVF